MDKEWQDILKRRNEETTDASGRPTAWDDAIKPEITPPKKVDGVRVALIGMCWAIAFAATALGGYVIHYAIQLYNCGI